MRISAIAITLALTLAGPAAHAVEIDFEGDTPGNKADGFVSASSPLASFSATPGSAINVGNTAPESIGNALRLFSGPTGQLQIDFVAPVTALSVVVGNDDPCCVTGPAYAWLDIFDGATLVDTVSLEMNMNDLPDQAISYVGGPFNRAQIWYGDSVGAHVGLTEIVDNVTFTMAETPEPATLALLATGLLGLAGLRRRHAAP
jgi:hypothetical protein